MSEPTTPHATEFTLTRRGYDVDQVDQALARLTAARDEAWQGLASLGDRMRGLERQLMDMREAQGVAEATVPDFEVLSPRAAGLLVTAEEEAEAVRSGAVQEAARIDAEARTASRRERTAAGQYADQLRAASDEGHRRELDRARSRAEAERAEADRDARALHDDAVAYADDIRSRAENHTEDAQTWLTGQQRAAAQEFAAHDVKVVAWEAEITAVGDRKLNESERHHKAMEAKSAGIDADAATQAERLLEAARREASRIAEASDREYRTFEERRDQIQGQLDHIRQTLIALTGTVAGGGADDDEAGPEDEADDEGTPQVDSESDTSELPTIPESADNPNE
ncbi:DivIVA domain-containing protein [Streptacidiphilus fuscans]|uniref:DivIVA domain-containing protein n=1 Tax=Streptacidiphilus fuscans TaxID=2789292 RepID=A0A931BI52_9ACTN|nr:DivIVA domain-containing protein [Streptacidiphilus fuscans]MBF9067792.1 DivIVA domain-containing protein [Streptacidiphilus fuscans]MBF9073875.1 DivIVA domain-containing protein [Streptacidiphilus fuscans]